VVSDQVRWMKHLGKMAPIDLVLLLVLSVPRAGQQGQICHLFSQVPHARDNLRSA
jgi:hypothetical protein